MTRGLPQLGCHGPRRRGGARRGGSSAAVAVAATSSSSREMAARASRVLVAGRDRRDRNRRRRSRRLPAPSPEPRASVRGAFRVSRSRECHLRGRRREREDDDGAALRRRRAGDQVLVPDVQRATEASRAQARGRARPREPGGALLPRARGEVLRERLQERRGAAAARGRRFRAAERRAPRSIASSSTRRRISRRLLHRLVLKAIRDRDASSSGATPASLLILGDSRQSIYQFRDADSRFLTFADRGLYRPATADADETENDESETDARPRRRRRRRGVCTRSARPSARRQRSRRS